MSYSMLLLGIALIGLSAFYMGRKRALLSAGPAGARTLHSLPGYYGWFVALRAVIPALLVFALWLAFQDSVIERLVINGLPAAEQALPANRLGLLMNDIRNLATGDVARANSSDTVKAAAAHYRELKQLSLIILAVVILIILAGGAFLAYRSVNPSLRARNRVERIVMIALVIASLIAILTTVGIVLSLLFESIRFFGKVPWYEFLFGIEWSPQTALRKDQVASAGSFGIIPVFAGTLMITLIAMIVAVPVGLFSAVYLSEYATPKIRGWVKPVMEILAGIPTVVYGFFAALVVAPTIRATGQSLGIDAASESALAAGLVMGIMIIPFVSSLSDDVINAVPQSLRDGAYGLGATKAETIRQVILPAALPGVVGAVLLAVSRAIGETMIVVMAAGLAANLTVNPFEAVTTVTVQIVTLLVGDQEFDSAKTLAAFALGLVLFVITLCLNVIALRVVQKYREKYD